jgi:hypothetical protein
MPKSLRSEPWQHGFVEANGLRFHLGKLLTRGMRAYFSGPFRITYLPGVSHWVQPEAPVKVNALLPRFLGARFPNGGPQP